MARLEGAWRMESYQSASKTGAEVNGVLIFGDGRWTTLFFTPGLPGAGDWGSAESGRYQLQNGRVTFHHEFTFQGGGGREMLMTRESAVVEECPVELDDLTLVIHFPSGSLIRCRRFGA